jgi:putative transposon-encoded protein
LNIAYSNIMPQKVDFQPVTEIKVVGVIGFMKRQVTAYGTGAKVTCPKEYLGKTVYLIVTDESYIPRVGRSGGQRSGPQK